MAVIDMPLERDEENDSETTEIRLRPSNPIEWTCEEVGKWLVEKQFTQYQNIFFINDVSGAVLIKMDRGSLAELVPSLGHRLSLLDEIERLRGPKVPRHVGEGVVGGISGFASKFMHGLNHLVSDPIEGASKDGVSGLVKGIGTGIAGAIQYPVEGVALFSNQLGDGFRFTPDTLFGANMGMALDLPKTFPPPSELDPRLKPAHLGEGLVIGFRRLGNGVYDGFTGLVTEPMRAAAGSHRESQSHQGFAVARGFAKGLAGAVCKPVAGSFDLASSTVEGLMATPEAIIAIIGAKDGLGLGNGPSIQDTPTFQRLANLRLPSPDIIRQRINNMGMGMGMGMGMRSHGGPEVVAQIDELRLNSRKEAHNSE